MVVGWYHSHPGFGCWLSGVDVNTQQSFEALNQRAVAVVVDPIQSVKGKVRPSRNRFRSFSQLWAAWSSSGGRLNDERGPPACGLCVLVPCGSYSHF